MNTENALLALWLTLFAGASTGIGSIIVVQKRKLSPKFLCWALGFSAGVMLYVSFVEILAKARDSLIAELGIIAGNWWLLSAFFGGIFLIGFIDRCIPSYENPHETGNINTDHISAARKKKLLRMWLFSALAIGIHNFPEWLVTFMWALEDPTLWVSLALAIAIHNIPEWIAVAAPIYHATKSKMKAFWISFAGWLAEPVWALLGYFILLQFFTPTLFGIIFAGVAWIMVYISLDELLPTAEEYGEHHVVIYSLIVGMMVMALSLMLFL